MNMLEGLLMGYGCSPYGINIPSMEPDRVTIRGTAGALMVRPLKDAVDSHKFQGHDVDLWLSSGWVEKEFILTGERKVVQSLYEWMKNYD